MAAVAAALAHWLPVELDVRVTADGAAVLHHDVDLQRLCGVPRRVSECSLHEVTPLRLAGSTYTVPTLAAALDLVGSDVPVLLDCKVAPTRRDRERMLRAVLRDVDRHPGPVAVVGFDPWLFARLHERAPHVLRGQSAGVVSSASRFPRLVESAATPLDRFWLNRVSRPDFLTYNVDRLPQPALARLRDSGLPVLGWTVRRTDQLAAVQGLVDNVIAEGEALQHLLRGPVAATA